MFTHSDQMMALGAVGGLFVRQNPDAEISWRLKELAASL
jgi:hypothetical protein